MTFEEYRRLYTSQSGAAVIEAARSAFDIHLQWFAPEDEGRTEDATDQKVREARKEGRVAKSPDLTSAIMLIFCFITIGIAAPYYIEVMTEMVNYFFTNAVSIDVSETKMVMPVFLGYFVKLTLPVFIVAFIAAILGNLIQVGFLFTVKTITPDFKKIVPNLGKFLKKTVFSGEAAFNLVKSIIKIAIIGVISFINIQGEVKYFINLVHVPFLMGVSKIASVGFNILIQAAIVMLILAIPDYIFQRYQYKQSLKMTKQEVKEERKQSEGDPMVKNRLRQRMRELLQKNMMQSVPKADVIVTNPTHFSVALQYDNQTMTAPTVTAKGQDNIALRIREVAKENGVPIIENKPLARGLFANVEIGDEVPEQYYEVVSRVLAEVYRLSGKVDQAV